MLKLLLATCLASLLAACGNNATDASGTAAVAKTGFAATSSAADVTSANAYTPPASSGTTAQSSPMKARDLGAAPAPTAFNLGTPTASQSATATRSSSNFKVGKPLQVGFSRQVSQTATVAATKQALKWQSTATGGKVAALSFTSGGAKGVRISLFVTQLPDSATLRFYAKGATTAFEVSGADVNATLARNLAAGDKTDAGRTYWGPVIDSAEGTMEIELPAGVSADGVEMAVPKVSHIFMSTETAVQLSIQPFASSQNGSLSCQVDIACFDPTSDLRRSVGILDFIEPTDGLEYICTGNFLNTSATTNNSAFSQAPLYVLTANHCISSQSAAASLYSRWFNYSATCNSSNITKFDVTTGSNLLFTSYNTDSTLLQLPTGTFPGGFTLAGWDASPPTAAITVETIHHPNGDPQRYSGGLLTNYVTRNSLETATIVYTSQSIGSMLEVVLTNGLVDHGSSGAALFKNFSSNPQVIGQLYGGYAGSCASPTVSNPQQVFYGRFDMAYTAGMSDWLNPVGNKRVSRFYNKVTGTHFYTIGVTETNTVKTYAQYNFESQPFQASVQAVAGLNPVYRFYNLNLGVHFYTINESERAWVVANLPQMRYEGIAWYAQPGAGGGTIPLYRFYNRDKGVHFYTVSAAERASVIANLPQMNDEGIAYYVLP